MVLCHLSLQYFWGWGQMEFRSFLHDNFRLTERSCIKAVRRKVVEQDQVLYSGICLGMSTYKNIHMGQVITHIHDISRHREWKTNFVCIKKAKLDVCQWHSVCSIYIFKKSSQSLLLSVKQNMMICYCSILLK